MTNAEWFDNGKMIIIRGGVYDPDGNPQVGILVSMFDTNNNLVKKVRTNTSGVFRLAFDKTTFVYGTYNLLYGFQGVKPKFKYDLDPGDYDTLMIWNFDSVISGQAANPWNSTTRYLKGAVVSHNGSIYKCILDDPLYQMVANLSVMAVDGPALTDSGASLAAGQQCECVASGLVYANQTGYGPYGPDGHSPLQGVCTNYVFPSLVWMSLVGAVNGTPVQLGSDVIFASPSSGELMLVVNDCTNYFSDNSGSFSVEIWTPQKPPGNIYLPPNIDAEHWQLVSQGSADVDLVDPSIFYAVGS